ncbi:MAG: beta-galactosidase [Candidatus Promineifilaceae bacterium]|nr:beta-galactosidase [Candidatus Promineifilaceae bacterium]
MMKFGVCYYPEHWPEARWAEDARMMREAGLEIVRIGEFAWSRMEPAAGAFDWAWLDRAVATLAGADLQVVLGTPTATPPAWLTVSNPKTRIVGRDGRRRAHGSRRHACLNSSLYRKHTVQVVEALARRYGGHPGVVGWQIDNEWGGGSSAYCYCENCARAFHRWLQERYSSLAALNEAWGTVFWSQSYARWDQIEPPGDQIDKPNPSHLLDYYRFATASVREYQSLQGDILRNLAPGHFVTTNFMGLFPDLDQFEIAEPLDFVSWDSYPTGNADRWRKMLQPPGDDDAKADPFAADVGNPHITGLAHTLTRSLKQAAFWVMEQQAGSINWGRVNPGIRDGTPRLWTWHAVSHGADTVVYFRWRATRFAQEQYHSGLLHHDGRPAVGYRDLQRLKAEMDQLEQVAAGAHRAQVALLFDFEDLWALSIQPHRHGFHYLQAFFVFYRALERMGIDVDIVSPSAIGDRYRLLLAPSLHLADETLAARLAEQVRAGAHLLLGIRSGVKTRSNLIVDAPLPGPLSELAGVTLRAWQALPDGAALPLSGTLPGLEGGAAFWAEALQLDDSDPEGARALAHYTAESSRHAPDEYDSAPALSQRKVGAGCVYYLGWMPSPDQAQALLAFLAERVDVEPVASLPAGLVARRRGDRVILMNFTDRALVARVGGYPTEVAARDAIVVPAAP